MTAFQDQAIVWYGKSRNIVEGCPGGDVSLRSSMLVGAFDSKEKSARVVGDNRKASTASFKMVVSRLTSVIAQVLSWGLGSTVNDEDLYSCSRSLAIRFFR